MNSENLERLAVFAAVLNTVFSFVFITLLFSTGVMTASPLNMVMIYLFFLSVDLFQSHMSGALPSYDRNGFGIFFRISTFSLSRAFITATITTLASVVALLMFVLFLHFGVLTGWLYLILFTAILVIAKAVMTAIYHHIGYTQINTK